MRKPQGIAQWLLKKTANRDETSAILGDAEEEFNEIVRKQGKLSAHMWYWLLIVISLPSFFKIFFLWRYAMVKNYIKIAFRNLIRYKGYSFINITGLAVGMACTILIAVYVYNELSFDRFHEKADRIYRVGPQFGPSVDDRGAYTAPPMAEAFLNDFPEVLHAVRLNLWQRDYIVRYGDKTFIEKGIIMADSSIFSVFTIPFLLGKPEDALTSPGKVVVTESTARKYFGDENPVGKTLFFEDYRAEFVVSGVVRDYPANSHFQFDMILPIYLSRQSRSNRWMSHSYFTYVVLPENYPPTELEAKFPEFIRRHYGPQFFEDTGTTFDDYFSKQDNYYGYWLQPLLDIHLNADISDNLPGKGDIKYVYAFSVIALFILLTACINFMNLSTARFARRSKEVGIRKALGSGRSQLVWQFIGESVLISCLSLVIAAGIVYAVLPVFGTISNHTLEIRYFTNFYTVLALLGFGIVVGILSGVYPSIFLSSFQPVNAIKETFGKGRKSGKAGMRKILVIFQFSITIFIFFGTFLVNRQLHYMYEKPLGFNKDQVVVIHKADALENSMEAFKQELLKHPDITCVSTTNSLPGRHFDENGHHLEGKPMTEEYFLFTMYSDYDFLELLDLKLVQGRFFRQDIASDRNAVVINETAVKLLGLTDPIGVRFHKDFGGEEEGEFVTIIGVLKDFHFQSLHSDIQPMIIRYFTEDARVFTSVRIKTENIKERLQLLEATWKKFTNGRPFEYSFLDSDFNNLYRAEQITGRIFTIFSFLAILIACLGLFGLISFSAEQRAKEIGIRKVLGASAINVVYILSREVLILVFFAAMIASPIAFFIMQNWLQNFAYRISIGPLIFIITIFLTLVMALLTMSYQAVKSAFANPVERLKYE